MAESGQCETDADAGICACRFEQALMKWLQVMLSAVVAGAGFQ
jgi:hypothetical protein